MARHLPDIRQADVAGKTVLIRADLNVPMKGGVITDATRIERFVPTVRDIVDRGGKAVIMTHLGRPNAEPNPLYSTRPIAAALGSALGCDVKFVSDCVGGIAERGTGNLPAGSIVLLENLRFHSGETDNSRNFAFRLSVNGDIYVNDAFSCAHRAHASTHAIASIMPAFAGPSLLSEVDALETALENPERPVAALVGGAKVSTKIDVLQHLVSKVDHLIVGGGMANTFLAALGRNVGTSLCERDAIGKALEILGKAEVSGCEMILPDDVVVAGAFEANAPSKTVLVDNIPADMMALDAGEKSCDRIAKTLKGCKTLLWNGPLGAFEIPPFDAATRATARTAAELTEGGSLVTVAGGGDTVAALNAAGVADRFTYVSTAGGAFLEWLEGKDLPGIEILKEKTLEEA
ncbi:phosphoglycerate kinase [Hoeflea sp. TYP-13]|uniref:phosphoglycerate kinase n=1 Tax=Hoeflea sp. TYP-13 TaxID=3230023 RepID=UPI0034C61A1A